MSKVKTFFSPFFNSIIPQYPYYSHIAKSRQTVSRSYFIVFQILLIFFFLAVVAIRYNPTVIQKTVREVALSAQSVPDEFSIKITDGTLSTTDKKPYFFWTTHENKKILLAVLFESAKPQDIRALSSLALINKDGIAIRHIGNNIAFFPFPKTPSSLVINKETIVFTLLQIEELIQQKIWPLFICILILAPLTLYIVNIIIVYTVFLSSLFVAWLLKCRLKAKQLLSVTVHASTLPFMLLYGLLLIFPYTNMYPVLILVLFVVFQIAGIFEAFYETLPEENR